MSISVFCSGCNITYRVKDQLAGKRGKCPQGHVLFVPPANADGAPSALPRVVQPAQSVPPASSSAVKEQTPLALTTADNFSQSTTATPVYPAKSVTNEFIVAVCYYLLFLLLATPILAALTKPSEAAITEAIRPPKARIPAWRPTGTTLSPEGLVADIGDILDKARLPDMPGTYHDYIFFSTMTKNIVPWEQSTIATGYFGHVSQQGNASALFVAIIILWLCILLCDLHCLQTLTRWIKKRKLIGTIRCNRCNHVGLVAGLWNLITDVQPACQTCHSQDWVKV